MKRLQAFDCETGTKLDLCGNQFIVEHFNCKKHLCCQSIRYHDYFSTIYLPRDNYGVFVGETEDREYAIYKDGEKIATFKEAKLNIYNDDDNAHILCLKDENDDICFLDENLRTIDNYKVSDFIPTTSLLLKEKFVCRYDGKSKKSLLYDGMSYDPIYVIDGYRVLNKFNDNDDLLAIRNSSMKEGTFKLYSLATRNFVTDIVFNDRPLRREWGVNDFYYPAEDLFQMFDEKGNVVENKKYFLDENDRTIIFNCENNKVVFECAVDFKLESSVIDCTHVEYIWSPLFYKKDAEIRKYHAFNPTTIEIVKDKNGYFDILVNGKTINREKIISYSLAYNGKSKFENENPNQLKCLAIDEDYDILDFANSNCHRNSYENLYKWRYGNLKK